MRLHEDRVFQDILFCRDLFSMGLEALDIAFDSLFHHRDGLFDGVPIGDAALESGDHRGESPFRFLSQENTVTDLVHEDHPNRIVRMDPSSL